MCIPSAFLITDEVLGYFIMALLEIGVVSANLNLAMFVKTPMINLY